MRRHAEGTTVSVGKTRGEIDDLVRRWGADGVSWVDDWRQGRMRLEFLWEKDGNAYMARFDVRLPDDEKLRAKARHASTHAFLPARFEKLQEARGRRELRVLLLWLKAAFEAVEEGLVDVEAIFLPFLVGRDGKTFAETALPNLTKLLNSSAAALLPEPA